jgi:Mg-chelatase subunit ChlI
MNGIVSVPESVQKKLSNVLLVRRQELEKPKPEVEEPSLLESWFSKKPEEPTKPEEQTESWFSKKPSGEEQTESWFSAKPSGEEQTESWFSAKPSGEEQTESTKPEEQTESWFATLLKPNTPPTPVYEKKCNIRGW